MTAKKAKKANKEIIKVAETLATNAADYEHNLNSQKKKIDDALNKTFAMVIEASKKNVTATSNLAKKISQTKSAIIPKKTGSSETENIKVTIVAPKGSSAFTSNQMGPSAASATGKMSTIVKST
jgi:DUF1009 family protein